MRAFARYVGIDYSGAQTPGNSLPGLRIFEAEGDAPPSEVPPPPSPRKYWARREIAEWLVDQLGGPEPLLVGIDHGFSFPLRYFEVHGLKPDWPSFLDDFQRHWPTDENIYVESVLEGREGQDKGSINQAGSYQGTEVMGVEIHVKDEARFPGKWAFFIFDGAKTAKMVPTDMSCYTCHTEHAAVDTTFVQFYPTLLPIAKNKGTLSAAYQKETAAAEQKQH